jgi:hypothetical protein
MGIGYWPPEIPRTATVESIIAAYESLGYAICYESHLEDGVQKVAIFGKTSPADGSATPTHAALQLESGEWTSKIGQLEDIRHTAAESVNGPLYGDVICFMARPRRTGINPVTPL